MPTTRLNELNGTVSALASALEKFVATAGEIEKDNRPLKHFKNGKVVGALTEEQFYDFGEIATDIFNRIDGVRNSPALIGLYGQDLKSEERYEQSVSEIARRAASLADEIDSLLVTASEGSQAVVAVKEEVNGQRAALDEEWESTRQTFEEMTKGAEKAKGDLEAVREDISTIKSEIDATTADLAKGVTAGEEKLDEINTFHSELAVVRTELKTLRERAETGDATQREYVERIASLISEAEGMVSGATTAGLAKAFNDERDRLSNAMGWALFSFLVGILFLFLTTILLAAYVFEIPIEILGYNVGQAGQTPERGDEITLAGVLSRTVILLAPFWLTLFSSRRYRNLFDLRQQYTHKYSMAFSVDGFKQQAPLYAEQMAAWVFHVVAEPPVSARSTKSMGDNPLPDIQSVVKDQLERFGILKSNSPAAE